MFFLFWLCWDEANIGERLQVHRPDSVRLSSPQGLGDEMIGVLGGMEVIPEQELIRT